MSNYTADCANYTLDWDYAADRASLILQGESSPMWTGKILPSFYIQTAEKLYADCNVTRTEIRDDTLCAHLTIGEYGIGRASLRLDEDGISLCDLSVRWNQPTSIIAMYFGALALTEEQLTMASDEVPFHPVWGSHEFCVPCAGGSPTHSFWRFWDMGRATLPLGSFGPSMGTPYSAAFPRPLYAFAMGKNGRGWAAIGAGEIPGAALSLQNRAGSGCLEYLFREDLWGAPDPLERSWAKPLIVSVATDAYSAYAAYFGTLGIAPAERVPRQMSFYCTWGQFLAGNYDLRRTADYITQQMPADAILIDDFWESELGSGEVKTLLFPDFAGDLDYARGKGLKIGLWQSLGWILNPSKYGLDASDLLCGKDGKPRRSAWIRDPHSPAITWRYCLDPSSERTREFMRSRIKRIVREHKADLLKLDFGYGMPDPNICAPRDPSMRGEKLCQTLLELTSSAAREENADISIIYYGINPLQSAHFDIVSIDDMGDCGESPEYELSGHSQRSLWASLTAPYGMAICASSGYYWGSFNEILLNSAVLGAQGTVLPLTDGLGNSITPAIALRWRALQELRVKSTSIYTAKLLDCDMGGRGSEPLVRSWARIEQVDGENFIRSAALRSRAELRSRADEWAEFAELPGMRFIGEWAVIWANDGNCRIVPFSAGRFEICGGYRSGRVVYGDGRSSEIKIDSDGVVIEVGDDDLGEIFCVELLKQC